MYAVFVTYENGKDEKDRPNIYKATFAWPTLIEIFEGLMEHLPPEYNVTRISINRVS